MKDGEPLWLEDDREWAIALLQDEADTCGKCGQPRSETLATQENERGRKVPLHKYDVERVECAGCRALSVQAQNDKDNPHPHAQGYRVIRVT